VLALSVAAQSIPGANAADSIFTVADVAVDVTAKAAAKARVKAHAEGQKRAFERLLNRLTLATDRDRVPALDSAGVAELVASFEVEQEKTSSVRYLATLTVRFKPNAVRSFLRGYGIGFAETRSKPLLVLPVYELAGARALWDEPNPWRKAWLELPPSDGLVPMIHPKGDLRDIAMIGAEQAVAGDDGRLRAIAARYGAADVLIVLARIQAPVYTPGTPLGPPTIQVTVRRLGTVLIEQTRIETFTPANDETMEDALRRAAKLVAAEVADGWKRSNRLRFDTGNVLMVTAPIRSLADWLEIQRRLAGVAFIRTSDLIYLSRHAARLRLHFIGDANQLAVALAQSDLGLDRGPVSWFLRLRGPQRGGKKKNRKAGGRR
jgi:hypothetical protein